MGEESPKPASTPTTGAVFLSYASQDAEAAERIATALRAAGIEVWFDKSELRGGDAWDRQIREQIHDCRLFIPVISANSERRDEGYFRREWRLAVERAGDMHEKRAFIVPVVIDGTSERGAAVPEKFCELQWTRLPGGETPTAFVERVRRLLSPEPSRGPTTTVSPAAPISTATLAVGTTFSRPRRVLLAIVAGVLLGAVAYFAVDKFSKHSAPPPRPPVAATSVAAAAFSPPPHSIAVLPFVNMSGDKDQEYFSDGLTEEILNSLARINELQVSARTSSFSFKGKDADITTIAHKLNVASVLEGSVRRAGSTVRITAQLNNAATGFHLWSQTYDRDLRNVLQLQTDIANAVANALKITVLGDVAAKVEVGGTRNQAALDAYLRATSAWWTEQNEKDAQVAIAGYTEAIRLDPQYALAYADRSFAFTDTSQAFAGGPAIPDYLSKGEVDARKAISLAPNLPEGHLSLAFFYDTSLKYTAARDEYQRALVLAPGKAKAWAYYGLFAVLVGDTDAGVAAMQRAVTLDPLNSYYHLWLGTALWYARQYDAALVALADAKPLAANDALLNDGVDVTVGLTQYARGDLASARAACEHAGTGEEELKYLCLAITYNKLGRHADAETMLGKLQASSKNEGRRRIQEANVYAQWGDTARALSSLEAAVRFHDSTLDWVKKSKLLDPLRKEPRFQAIERELKFPQ